MALTEKQMIARQQSVGGSDVPAILGISPFKSAVDVFFEKTHEMKQVENSAMEAGHMLEPAVIDWAITRLEVKEFSWSSANVRRTKILVAESGFEIPAHANLDFMFINTEPQAPRNALEAKTTGMPQYWGSEWTDEVPDHVLVQCLWQAMIADLDKVYVAVLIGDHGFNLKMYVVEPSDYEEECSEIKERVGSFWNKNVMEGLAPEESAPRIETLKKIIRTPGKSKELSEMNLQSWLQAKDEVSTARKKEKELRATLISELSDAEIGESSHGQLTYHEYNRKEYTVSPSTYRAIRWRPRKD